MRFWQQRHGLSCPTWFQPELSYLLSLSLHLHSSSILPIFLVLYLHTSMRHLLNMTAMMSILPNLSVISQYSCQLTSLQPFDHKIDHLSFGKTQLSSSGLLWYHVYFVFLFLLIATSQSNLLLPSLLPNF